MSAWLLIALIVGVCLTVLIYLKAHKEPFVSFQDLQMSGNVFTNQMEFTDKMGTYAADTAAKGVFTNPGVSLGGLNEAAKQPDMYLATTTDRDYASFFTPDPENAFNEDDKKFCRGASYPLDLPARKKFSRVACGWWFHPTEKSVGVLATVDGPIFNTNLPAGGSFYWNLQDAALKEDYKKCKAIKDCEMIELPGIKGKCAWCDLLGHAIPSNSDGSEKYPDAVDEPTCGEPVISNSGRCPKPEAEQIVAENGVSCGNLGKPSADNYIRVYSEGECKDSFRGNWYSNGECLNPLGGSYSWDCRGLNAPLPPVPITTCTPDARGNLSRACLIQTAKSLGFSNKGSIYRMLYTTNGPSENDKLAIQYLTGAGVPVPDAVLGAGNIDRMSAASIYMEIYNMISQGKTELVRQSAKLLAVGTTEFDACSVDGSQTGPFNVTCAQRAFRQAGCQPAGTSYPNRDTVSELASMTWDQVNASFQQLRAATGSGNTKDQDKALKQCFGFNYSRAPPLPCENTGMEHIMYSFAGRDWVNVDGIWYLAFVGSLRQPTGLRQINVGYGVVADTGGRSDEVQMKVRSIVNGGNNGINGQLDCWTDDGLMIWVGGSKVLNVWYDQAPTYHACSVNFPAAENTIFEINWYERGGHAVIVMRNTIEAINRNAYLPYPMDSPIIAFDFYRGRLDDCHQVLRSRNVGGVGLQSRGGRQGAYFGQDQAIQILTPIRRGAVKSYTFMLWHDDVHTYQMLFFLGMFGKLQQAPLIYIHTWWYYAGWGDGNQYMYGAALGDRGGGNNRVKQDLAGRWAHVAFIWNDADQGFRMYIDGLYMGDQKQNDGGPQPDYVYTSGFIGNCDVINRGWYPDYFRNTKVVMAWCHMYSYKLTVEQIKKEMKYWDDPAYNGNIYDFPSHAGQSQYMY